MSERRLISSHSAFEAVAGYSRAVVDGDDIFVSGTTGYDYTIMELPEICSRRPMAASATSPPCWRRPAPASMTWCGCATS